MDHAEAVHVPEPENELLDPVVTESRTNRLFYVRGERSMLAVFHENPEKQA